MTTFRTIFFSFIKRDAFEFLTALCTKYDYVKNLVQHQTISTYQCNRVLIQKLLPTIISFFQYLLAF